MGTNKTWQAVVAFAVFMMVTGGLMTQPAAAESAGNDATGAARLLELANRDRAQAGLPALSARSDVTAAAAGWSSAMADTQVLAHNDAYFSAESKRRLGAKSLGENVARNGSVDDAHARLMASPGHRANLMSGAFTVVGMAIFRDGSGTLWVTQAFLQPAAAAPAPAATPAPAPKAAPAPSAAPAPTPAPVRAPAAAPAPVQPAPTPTTVATVELDEADLISAPAAPVSADWSGSRPAPFAAAGAQTSFGAGHLALAAACANALAAIAAIAALRRRQAA